MFALKTIYINTLVILQPFLFTLYEIETEYHKKRQSIDSRVMTGMYKYIRQYNFSVVFDTTSLSQNGVLWKPINIRY